MKKLILFLCTLAVFSCKNTSLVELPANEFVGTWKLISFCRSKDVNSACTQTTIPSDKGVFISFTNDKKFNEFYTNTKPFEYAFLGCGGGGYDIVGSELKIVAGCMSSIAGQKFPVVSLDTKRLVLQSPFNKDEYVFEKQ